METIEKIENLQLIKGTFSHSDAKQVILDLIERKIKFHVLRNFTANERCNEDHEESIQKIKLLTNYKEEVVSFFDSRIEEQNDYFIESLINVTPKQD